MDAFGYFAPSQPENMALGCPRIDAETLGLP